jgi:hypothetical protein
MTNKASLGQAVQQRRLVRFDYDGQPRLIQPRALSRNARGKWLIEGCQVAGYSKSRSPLPWRSYFVDRIDNLEVLEDTFMPWQTEGEEEG